MKIRKSKKEKIVNQGRVLIEDKTGFSNVLSEVKRKTEKEQKMGTQAAEASEEGING